MKKSAVIIAAGGCSTRFKDNKLLALLQGRPVFLSCVETFAQLYPKKIAQIVLVVSEKEVSNYQALIPEKISKRIDIVLGGKSRTESVWNGMRALRDEIELVAIHDAARPFVSADLLERCLASAQRYGSGVAAHRCVDTIKQADADGVVQKTLNREQLWAVETPQAFEKIVLEKAYRMVDWKKCAATDDAQLLELAGMPVRLVENLEDNKKITYRKDLAV
ncbi:MAG: 2-C-methyl-D-erythritol 4-phosphate cytidylyltransferase [Lentisphaeria bacterium]